MGDLFLHINISNPSHNDDDDYVIIEQEPWGVDVGRTSNIQGITAIGSMIFGGSLPLPNCGGFEEFNTPVHTYPSRPTLNYSFIVSHGDKSLGGVDILKREEVLQCSLQDYVTLGYPPIGGVTLKWIGNCYDVRGNVVARPSIDRKERYVGLSRKVYGSIRARYSVYRKTFNINIKERDDSIDNNFECAAIAHWSGGVTIKEIEAPSGFDTTLGNCGNGIYGSTWNGEEVNICDPSHNSGSYPVSVTADRSTSVDYCNQEIISDSITESVDYDSDKGECSG